MAQLTTTTQGGYGPKTYLQLPFGKESPRISTRSLDKKSYLI